MRRIALSLSALFSLVCLASSSPRAGRAAEPDVPPRRSPNAVHAELDRSLQNLPELKGMVLVYADRSPDGVVSILGLLGTEDQRAIVRQRALEALRNAIDRGRLRGPVTRIEVARMRVGSTALDRLLVIEEVCPQTGGRLVVIQRYVPQTGALALAGIVESRAARERLREQIERLTIVGKVEVKDVLIGDGANVGRGSDYFYNQALDGLAQGCGTNIIQAATEVISRGYADSTLVVNAWYLRAAGFLLLNQTENAVGALRLADLLERRQGYPSRFRALERFQGPQRQVLSQLLREGPRASLVIVVQQK